jgi:hypothetical protein
MKKLMKKLSSAMLITFIMVAGLAFSAEAQRADKTSSAKAYYGIPYDKPNSYDKANSKPKKTKNKKHQNNLKKSTTNRSKTHIRSGWVYRLESSTFQVASLDSRFNIPIQDRWYPEGRFEIVNRLYIQLLFAPGVP